MKTQKISIVVAMVLCLAVAAGAQAGWDEGVAAFKKGDLATATKEFKAITEAQPDWPGGHFMLGWAYLKQKQTQEAVAHLRKAYELQPDNLAYQVRLGEAYVAAGRYRDAVAFLAKIDVSKLPKDQQAFLTQLRAVAYTKTGQDDAALREFATAARLEPNDAQTQFQYGTAAYNSGDTATAATALGKAASLDPGDADKLSAYVKALNRLGRESKDASKLSAYRKAADAAAKLVALSSSFDNLMLLGEAQLGGKQYDAAVDTFQNAAEKNGADWLPLYYVGQAYTAKQQYRSAESALRQSLDKTSASANQVKIWKQLGFVYEKQRKFDDAIAAYQQAGDQGGVRRVEENRQITEYNESVEQEAEEIRRLQEEQEKIREQLQELPGGPPPGI